MGTQPVGRLRSNPWGLYDTHGNVWEWCADWKAGDYYAKAPPDDPTGPDSGTSRVLRGNSWSGEAPSSFRCASHLDNDPGRRYLNNGFRVARTVTP